MKTMSYRGYTAKIEYSDEDQCFIGNVIDINDIICFHGNTDEELQKAFEDGVDLHIESEKKDKQMHQMKINECEQYHSFPRNQFPNRCIVCNERFRFASDLYILPPLKGRRKNDIVEKNVYPQKQTYYTCDCLKQNHAWLAYTESIVREYGIGELYNDEIDELYEDEIPTISLDMGYVLQNYALLTDIHGSSGIVDENSMYHHQHHNNDNLIYFRVPIDNILLTPYIRKIAAGDSDKAEEIEKKCKKLVDIGTSLSLLSIMNFHNANDLFGNRWMYGNLSAWLGFDTEIKDLYIYTGAPFWEHIKKSLLVDSVVSCVEFAKHGNFSHLYKETENLKVARDKFIAHWDADGDNEETKGYIDSLYLSFNEFVKDFNNEYNKHPYNLSINLDELYYVLPKPHTPCDDAFGNILRLIQSQYDLYMKQQAAYNSNIQKKN
ncbi:MAG: hypothetical protein OXG97_08165 [Candidatus Poribacteria bacterium]|nr:hypothetical protein [Candidatus Poribacteria bacterium]